MKMHRYTLEEAQEMARRDKRRMIVLGAGVLLIGAVYFMAPQFGGDDGAAAALQQIPTQVVPDIPIEPIPFESPELLAKIRDDSDASRATLDVEALLPVFTHARRQTPQHFVQLGIRSLDADVAAEVMAAPSEHRLAALRVRGEVVDVERRRREGGTRDDWLVALRGAGGVIAHALFANPPSQASSGNDERDAVKLGDFLRLDGLFFKVYRQEVGDAWLEGPLVVGHQALSSFPPMDARVARSAPALANVQDDEVGALHANDDVALWQLMARSKLLGAETNWADAPELDQATLARIFEDGDTYRGAPFRFPISRNMGAVPTRAPENPLGVDVMTEGWIGNVMWRTPVGVVNWLAPYDIENLAGWNDPQKAQFVEARGWFFRNRVYTKVSGEPGRAPMFVLAGIEPFIPPPDNVTAAILWFVSGLAFVVVSTIFILLMSDKRKSIELQEALVRRRRARRERAQLSSAAQS